MYRTIIDGYDAVIRFPLHFINKQKINEEQVLVRIASMEKELLLYKNECFAIHDFDNKLIIVSIHEGEVLDIQIQQVIFPENIIK